ncbi:MAG TPA: hypothetical protein VNX60_02665 [Candidatus Acidoferrum sp.]|nr:hypothetical protein [Candidatus Acidoferrum sp.]
MTCQELHNYFEGNLCVDTNRLLEVALAEHIAACLLCNRFVKEQKELEEHLRIARNSAPPIPASLDNAVLANYRSFVFDQSRLAKSTPLARRINPRAALGWAAAVAFALVVAYGGALLVIPRQHVEVRRQYTVRQSTAPQAQATANKETAPAQIVTRKAPKPYGDSGKRANNRALPAEGDYSFPTRFQSLMYCDQISCSDTMDVIRVQLPSPVMGITPASARMGRVVSADVLVGPDGIARGIRVVE